ncbi:uncharacterized protein SCHCODRAFT_02476257, partial [Schizophyllum commune H4-8]|uniref:uncharacterized protein n=1 Tax=Schizophyllum commune (strain H4-8 / FGSC 9210) TaxID=578458 RepID=UPI00215F5BC0
MATNTITQEEPTQNVRRNAPRTSDTITRRGHHGPVPLPTDSAFIPIGTIPASPQGTAPTYLSPPYQNQGSIPYAYPEQHRSSMANYPSFPSIHLSQAEYSSTPAHPAVQHYATSRPQPRPDPLATPRGRALEAWRIFRLLGEHPHAAVPTDPMDGYVEIVQWLRYFAVSLQRGYVWTRHIPFFSDLRCARELADLLRATRDVPESHNISFEEYDLTDLVGRAERSGLAPLQLREGEGVSFIRADREPPITIG